MVTMFDAASNGLYINKQEGDAQYYYESNKELYGGVDAVHGEISGIEYTKNGQFCFEFVKNDIDYVFSGDIKEDVVKMIDTRRNI